MRSPMLFTKALASTRVVRTLALTNRRALNGDSLLQSVVVGDASAVRLQVTLRYHKYVAPGDLAVAGALLI